MNNTGKRFKACKRVQPRPGIILGDGVINSAHRRAFAAHGGKMENGGIHREDRS